MSTSKPPTERPDPIGDLIRQAGPRPTQPELDLESLAAPALEVWQRQVAQRRSRRHWLMAALFCVALGAGLLWRLQTGPASGPQPTGAVVVATAGLVPEIALGELLDSEAELTTEADQWLTLELTTGHRLRLDAATTLRWRGTSRLELLRGAVYVEAAPGALEILAGQTRTEHLGTRYAVRIEGEEVTVRVRHGRVQVSRAGQTVEAAEGEAVHTEETGLSMVASPTHGPSWAWTRRAAPPAPGDGVDLATLLAWVEAETGWQVDVDPTLLLDAAGKPVTVRGSVDGLEPEEAVELVLESAGLTSSVADGVLRIRAVAP